MAVTVFSRRALQFCGALSLAAAAASCTSLLGDFKSTEGSPDAALNDATTNADGANGIPLGTACTSSAQCGGNQCADGVCCNTACDGVCMKCNLPSSPGTCSPIPAHTDPDMECVIVPIPDAGAPVDDAGTPSDAGAAADGADGASDGAVAEGGVAEAGVVDAGAPSDAAPVEAGATINFPDSGLSPDAGPCAGSCNGAGACAYPAAETVCGTRFCNTSVQAAAQTCDGTGRCTSIALENCTDYACKNDVCATSCASPNDCQSTDRCTAPTCTPKLDNGLSCTVPTDCQSGNCVAVSGSASVCCTSECNVPGGTCAGSASTTGQCTCPACANGGTCAIFYPDNDHDGHGDKNAVLSSGVVSSTNAVVACAGSPPVHNGVQYPAAYYVTNNDDCNDQDLNAYPGSPHWGTTPTIGTNSYDYNCDNTVEMLYPQYPGKTCQVCGAASACAASSCGTSGANSFASLACPPETELCSCVVIYDPPVLTTEAITTESIEVQSSPPVGIPIQRGCTCAVCGVNSNDRGGYISTTTVGCGQSGEFVQCGSCSGSTLGASTYTYPTQQCQ